MLADLYRVTAGGSSLRSFFTKNGGSEYAAGVIKNSHANIGNVELQGRCSETGDWHTLRSFGVPANEFSLNDIPVTVVPALATPGKFIVASQRTGNTLNDDNRFGSDEPLTYFDSVDDASAHVLSLNKPTNPRQYVLV
jgi:hypothetical protein